MIRDGGLCVYTVVGTHRTPQLHEKMLDSLSALDRSLKSQDSVAMCSQFVCSVRALL